MTEADARMLSTQRKRRGVVRASLTRLNTKLCELESSIERPNKLDLVKRLATRLDALDSDYKVHHLAIIDLLDDEAALQVEQDALDEHDDHVSDLDLRIRRLVTACSERSDSHPLKMSFKHLSRLEKKLSTIGRTISSLSKDVDNVCVLHQHEEQLYEFKKELSDVRSSLLSFDLEEGDEVIQLQSAVERNIFDCSLQIKTLLHSNTPTPSTCVTRGVKLPKIDVPTFDGNILNWRIFWEQFCVSVHDRNDVSDSEKLVYLQHALKDGKAKNAIEGLSRSGEHYIEAVDSLKARYDRPRLIHQGHVRVILEASSLKEGNGRELRQFHDTIQQHLRALKAMGHEPSNSFITSMLELKLDKNTMFEWQRYSQASVDVPPYRELLNFVDLRAQASESLIDSGKKPHKNDPQPVMYRKYPSYNKPIASFMANADATVGKCVVCKTERHPLYVCPKFRAFNHEKMLSTLKSNSFCLNCLRPGHYVKTCVSLHRCKRCQKPHHTLLHVENKEEVCDISTPPVPISSHAALGIKSNLLLMTCCVLVEAPDGSSMVARAILDSASSASFVSEKLAQSLKLPRSSHGTTISGVAGLMHNKSTQSIANCKISSQYSPTRKFDVTAVIVPRVTCDLPLHPITFNPKWDHLSNLQLADPGFAQPGRIDLLLGVEIYVEVMLHGRRKGIPNSPFAFETELGWVLAGATDSNKPANQFTTHHASLLNGDDLLRQFWEVEENPSNHSALSSEDRSVLHHFKTQHSRTPEGRFVVPLPKGPGVKPLGESRSQAVRRFLSFERSMHTKGHYQEFEAVMDEYFQSGHAEPVPEADLDKPPDSVFYLPIHVVRKESSTTTKVRAVFDASAKSSTGVSLNDTLLVGPTVHSSLVDVLLRFRLRRIALTTDISRMYRAVSLTQSDRDLHRFVWRREMDDPLKDYRMTRVTFGVSSSSFIANMCVKQNSVDLALKYPLASRMVNESFYVDDGLTGADSIEDAIEMHNQLQDLFNEAGFLLRKWNSSEPMVLEHIKPELRDSKSILTMPDPTEYTKTLGIEWNAGLDHFRLTVADLPRFDSLTKRALVSDIAKTFDILGWFSPCIIKAKILLQRLWEEKIGWDDTVPSTIQQAWSKWRVELNLLSERHIPRCYFPKDANIVSMQLHGFSDASEQAYAGVVYFRMTDSKGRVHTPLVMSKTKVAPIKRLTIPRLELCGAHILSQMLHHCKEVFSLPSDEVYAWTDSTIVLNWLAGNPRRFKTYVGNRVSQIMQLIAPNRWNHVNGLDNPADCASRGLFPSELLNHTLWWNGPTWLSLDPGGWPSPSGLQPNDPSVERDEICVHAALVSIQPVIPLNHFSNFTRLKRTTTWLMRFVNNCRAPRTSLNRTTGPLTVEELNLATSYWISLSQEAYFTNEIRALKMKTGIPLSSCLLPLNPFLDGSGLLRVGGRERNSKLPYYSQHPIIIHSKHPLTRIIIRSEHLRLLHAGPTLLTSSLCRRFYIIGCRKIVRSITRCCVTCQRRTSRPQPQMMGQLPMERVTPDTVFDKVGVDYAGPVYVKQGSMRKPTFVKAYICVFVSLSVKAVHLELVSDLTSEAFIACLRRFIARRGKPSLIWSDHGTNFVGAVRLIRELFEFLQQQKTTESISDFCTSQNIEWVFIPERAPHFGGLWEAAVKSTKTHLTRIVANAKLTFEEFITVLTQIEACLNSRPLASLPCDDDGIEALTPGHFLIGRPMAALPDPSFSYRTLSLLRRWHLCQNLVRHFWQRWSSEYLTSLQKFAKWYRPSKNITVGDIVVLREDGMVPTRWPLARVVQVHTGQDGLVRVVTLKTSNGTYTRPVTKVAPLIPCD